MAESKDSLKADPWAAQTVDEMADLRVDAWVARKAVKSVPHLAVQWDDLTAGVLAARTVLRRAAQSADGSAG